MDIIYQLEEFGIEPIVVDPLADVAEVKHEYGIDLIDLKLVSDVDCIVFAVAHDQIKAILMEQIDGMFKNCPNNEKIIIDIKSILSKESIGKMGYSYWRL